MEAGAPGKSAASAVKVRFVAPDGTVTSPIHSQMLVSVGLKNTSSAPGMASPSGHSADSVTLLGVGTMEVMRMLLVTPVPAPIGNDGGSPEALALQVLLDFFRHGDVRIGIG